MVASSEIPNLQQPSDNPLPDCPGTPNCVRTSRSFSVDSTLALKTAENVLKEMGAESIELNPDKKEIHAVFKIPVFGWRDDVNIAIQEKNSVATLFIRSASRDGTWDVWVNPIRINKFFKLFNKQLSH